MSRLTSPLPEWKKRYILTRPDAEAQDLSPKTGLSVRCIAAIRANAKRKQTRSRPAVHRHSNPRGPYTQRDKQQYQHACKQLTLAKQELNDSERRDHKASRLSRRERKSIGRRLTFAEAVFRKLRPAP